MTISFIIITYNNEKTIEKCLLSIKKSVLHSNLKITAVLLDNNSTDSSAEMIKKYSDAETAVLINSDNAGFAKTVNQGLTIAKEKFDPDFFFLLNPDAYLEKDALSKIISFHEITRESALSSPVIMDPLKKNIWFSGAKTSWFSQKTKHLPLKKTKYPYQVKQLSGCSLCIPKEALKKIHSFDERFFLYYEDADFCLRAKKANIKNFIVPLAIGYHVESQSSSSETKCYHLVKSGLLFFHKNYPLWAKPYFWITFFARYLYHRFISKKTCVLNGMKDFLIQYTGKERNNGV